MNKWQECEVTDGRLSCTPFRFFPGRREFAHTHAHARTRPHTSTHRKRTSPSSLAPQHAHGRQRWTLCDDGRALPAGERVDDKVGLSAVGDVPAHALGTYPVCELRARGDAASVLFDLRRDGQLCLVDGRRLEVGLPVEQHGARLGEHRRDDRLSPFDPVVLNAHGTRG
eukprot:2215487-Pleurochrysis_carterae.AAC.2